MEKEPTNSKSRWPSQAEPPSLEELARALDQDEFAMYIQFIYDIHKDGFIGAEALSRWLHPEHGVILPGTYIEKMRQSHLIERLDMRMLEKSCRLLETWGKNSLQNLYLSCNFTRETLACSDFYDKFSRILERFSFDRKNLIMEITEDDSSGNKQQIYQNIVRCKALGVQVALDDLGAGYTSFNDLCDFPIDLIKIDRHMTQRAQSQRGRALLNEIVHLAHHMNIQVLCEGVETEEERSAITEIGCDYIQGFYFSHVLPLEEAEKRLQSDKNLV